jgi:hypothetical protein
MTIEISGHFHGGGQEKNNHRQWPLVPDAGTGRTLPSPLHLAYGRLAAYVAPQLWPPVVSQNNPVHCAAEGQHLKLVATT